MSVRMVKGKVVLSKTLPIFDQPEKKHVLVTGNVDKEYRHCCGVRFDLLDPAFLEAMATIMGIGAKKYGERNWEKGLIGENSGVNHAFKHLIEYQAKKPNDYGPRRMHLAQAAVNAMFEFFHCKE